MIVDDPRASIERAAGLVDDRVKSLIESVTERQRSMQSAWQAHDAGTEELPVGGRWCVSGEYGGGTAGWSCRS
jgi:hypothetical protein